MQQNPTLRYQYQPLLFINKYSGVLILQKNDFKQLKVGYKSR